MNRVIIFLLFLLSPFLGLYISALGFNEAAQALDVSQAYDEIIIDGNVGILEDFVSATEIDTVFNTISNIEEEIGDVVDQLSAENARFKAYATEVSSVKGRMATQTTRSNLVYDTSILRKLGAVVYAYKDDRVDIKIFQLNENSYKGFIAKVRTFDDYVVKVKIAEDSPGKKVALSKMAEESEAIFAVNGGGFGNMLKDGEYYTDMLGNTVVNSSIIDGYKDQLGLFFAGVDSHSKLVGSMPASEADITSLKPYGGVSFVPELLNNFKKSTIPGTWSRAKHPRTVIAKYPNEDLVFAVIDGRQPGWSLGVSLETLQDKLLDLGISEAYNLDGGGSSSMYFGDEIISKYSGSTERLVPNAFIIEAK